MNDKISEETERIEALAYFGLPNAACASVGSGLINRTWLVESAGRSFILQRINGQVFRHPEAIAANIRALASYLAAQAPGYLFAAPIAGTDGLDLFRTEGGSYRLFPYIPGSHTIDTVRSAAQAREAAAQFGRFTALLEGFDAQKLATTIPDFHNLALRARQLEAAVAGASADRLDAAASALDTVERHRGIVTQYEIIVRDALLPFRVIHHDTKISNVLFGEDDRGLCVIDLDTVMPGYFISDLGDMFRTYLSPASEEERDLSKVDVRPDVFRAVVEGYLGAMGPILTAAERELVFYAGPFLIHMQAIRFLADYLNGDTYYATHYPGQNLARTQNQLTLLEKYLAREGEFRGIIGELVVSSY